MTLKLVVRLEAYGGPEELILCESSYGIGRLHDNDISIQNECVSGYHAELTRTPDGGYTLSDLKSTNGTFLNGSRVTSPERVKPGDQVKLGNLLILVAEHVEVVTQPENLSKVVSLKDIFDFESGANFNTYPIAPVRTPPAPVIGSEGPKQPVKMEEAVPGSGPAPQEIERAREAERLQQIERAKEVERLQQIERAKEVERLQQIERAKEVERLQQIERAREAERQQQLQRAREVERQQQIERAKEAERLQQLQRAREAERLQQLQLAREAERAQQIERAREAERLQQLQRARETERAQQIARAREAERAEVDLRERQVPANSEDFSSKIQSLATQLESAMREIGRLSALLPREAPRPVEVNGQSAGPVNPGQPLAIHREEPATPRPQNSDGKVVPTEELRVVREGYREEVRAVSHNPPPLPGQNSGNEVAFGVFRQPPILSTAQLRQQLEAARSAGKGLVGNEARLAGDNAGRV